MENTKQIKPGDIVRLNSGSPDMTVEWPSTNASNLGECQCIWYNNGEFCSRIFYIHILTKESL